MSDLENLALGMMVAGMGVFGVAVVLAFIARVFDVTLSGYKEPAAAVFVLAIVLLVNGSLLLATHAVRRRAA